MLTKLKNSKGFTIIEVMIVLAIAGMIILVVLLAVPALQRNSRNTAIKNDASALAAAITEFESNNDGQVPDAMTADGSSIKFTIQGNNNVTESEAKVQGSTQVDNVSNSTGNPPAQAGEILPIKGYTCPDTDGNTKKSTRAYSLYYNIETSDGLSLKCLDT